MMQVHSLRADVGDVVALDAPVQSDWFERLVGVRLPHVPVGGGWGEPLHHGSVRLQARVGRRAVITDIAPGLFLVAELPDLTTRRSRERSPVWAPGLDPSAAKGANAATASSGGGGGGGGGGNLWAGVATGVAEGVVDVVQGLGDWIASYIPSAQAKRVQNQEMWDQAARDAQVAEGRLQNRLLRQKIRMKELLAELEGEDTPPTVVRATNPQPINLAVLPVRVARASPAPSEPVVAPAGLRARVVSAKPKPCCASCAAHKPCEAR